MAKKREPPKETWTAYHRKDKDAKIEHANGNANLILSSTPDTKRIGLGAVAVDLSDSPYIATKTDRHTRLISGVKELREAVLAWMEVESESKTNNPCPDYGLRAVYYKKALRLSKIALNKIGSEKVD